MERNPNRVAEVNDVLGAVAIVGDGAEVTPLALAGLRVHRCRRYGRRRG